MSIELYHGDCLELMKQIPDGSVDMILTDPPYGTTACKWDNVIPFEPMWEQIWRVLKPNGACLLFGSEPFSSALRMSQIKRFKYDWVWDTQNKVTGYFNAKRKPLTNHEIVSVFSDGVPLYQPQPYEVNYKTRKFSRNKSDNYSSGNNIDHGRQISVGFPRSILRFPGKMTTKQQHPTQKPVALLEYLIKTYTLEGETVLDFTMGSGSTGVACVNTGRKFIGIEMDDKYFDIASKRIAEAKPDGKLWE